MNNPFASVPISHLLVKYDDAQKNIFALLNSFSEMFNTAQSNQACTGTVFKAAAKALISSMGGKIIFFISNIPNTGQGLLKGRDRSVSADTIDKNLLNPQHEYYSKLATACVKHAISVDMFVGTSQYVDITTLATATKTTGGQIYYYPNFTVTYQEQLYRELYRTMIKEGGFDALMRLRCGQGIVIKTEHGNAYKDNDTEISVASISADSCFLFELGYDDSLKDERGAIFQLAIVYTTANGERYLRVHTLCVPVTTAPQRIFKGADVDTILNFLIRQSLLDVVKETPDQVRKKFVQKIGKMFAMYKKHCAPTHNQPLVLPESLSLLPIYSLGFFEIDIDWRKISYC
jgi:protein transport protein SEC24